MEKLQPVVVKVKQFFNLVWEKIGAPIWDLVKQYAAQQWAQIKEIGRVIGVVWKWVWEKTAWARALASRAWTWVKNKLGIGEGAEGQDGILQWVQRKLDSAWGVLKAKLEPFTKQIVAVGAVIGGVALALSPAGPVLAVGAAVVGAVQGLRWIHAHWGKGDMIVQARLYIEKSLIPPLLSAANRLSAGVITLASTISSKLESFAAALTRAAGGLGGSLLRIAASAVQWIADQAVALASWAQQHLVNLSHSLTAALDKLQAFLRRMLALFGKLAHVIINIWSLPLLLAGELWNAIPACIRDPIVDFLGPIILRQIEIFQELARDNDAWQKTKADVGKIIRLVFKDHDLVGAVKATFYLILRVFNIPPDLLVTIARKAISAWEIVSKKPLEFIKNTVRALGHGFRLLWANFGAHLKYGLQGWLFGALAEKNISPPSSWTEPKAVFNFVLEVLGLSVNNMFELLKRRFDVRKVEKARVWFGRIAGALDWINKAIDTSKSPAENSRGLIDKAKEFGLSILTGIAEWVATKVAEELAMLAAAAAASAGLSEALDVVRRIYKAILTAVRWARRILDMANQALDSVLDIAGGAVVKAGATFEQIMHRGMPVVIGFLADQVGLGGIGTALSSVIGKLRDQVDAAILWVIDKIKAGLEALINLVKAGAKAVLNWWAEKRQMRLADGEQHTLRFARTGQSVRLMLASTEKPLQDHLKEAINGTELDDSAKDRARDALKFFTVNILPLTSMAPDPPTPALQSKIDALPDNLNQLAAKLMAIVDGTELPKEADWSFRGPSFSQVKKLSNRTSRGGADARSGMPEGWKLLRERGLTTSHGNWVRMHMISAAIGGPDDRANLLPAPTAVNSKVERDFEQPLKRILYGDIHESKARASRSLFRELTQRNAVIWVLTKTARFRDGYTEPSSKNLLYDGRTFPEIVYFAAGMHYPRNKTWHEDPAPLVQLEVKVPPPDFAVVYVPDMNDIGEIMLAEKTKISLGYARLIAKLRGGTPAVSPFKDARDFEERMTAVRGADRAPTPQLAAAVNAVIGAAERGEIKWRK